MREISLEEFQNDRTFPFFIQYGYHSGNFFLHEHKNFTELVFVLSGTAKHAIENEAHLLSKGDVFVVGEHTKHNIEQAVDFIPCNILFQKEFFFEHFFQLKEVAGFHALFYLEPYLNKESKFKSRLKLSFQEFEEVFALLEKMMREYENKEAGWKDMIVGYFYQVIVLLSRYYQLPKEEKEANLLLVANASSYIEKNFQNEITIETLASLSCLSTRHFSRIFKEIYKITPMQYLFKLRILYASELLKNTSKSIAQIADESGFTDQNYFSRSFKKQFKVTPREYRKSLAAKLEQRKHIVE